MVITCLSCDPQEGDVVVKCHQTGDQAIVTWMNYSKVKQRYRELNGKTTLLERWLGLTGKCCWRV